jgi:hypothetical protein
MLTVLLWLLAFYAVGFTVALGAWVVHLGFDVFPQCVLLAFGWPGDVADFIFG